jgi:hypothetical protein
MIDLISAKRKCLPMRGVLRMGGDSDSDASTSQVDNTITQGNGGIVARDGSSVNVWNTSDKALDLVGSTTGKAFDVVDSVVGRQAGLTKDLTTQAFNAINKTGDLVSAAYADAKGRGAMTDTITITAIAGACLVAALALKKAKT